MFYSFALGVACLPRQVHKNKTDRYIQACMREERIDKLTEVRGSKWGTSEIANQ